MRFLPDFMGIMAYFVIVPRCFLSNQRSKPVDTEVSSKFYWQRSGAFGPSAKPLETCDSQREMIRLCWIWMRTFMIHCGCVKFRHSRCIQMQNMHEYDR